MKMADGGGNPIGNGHGMALTNFTWGGTLADSTGSLNCLIINDQLSNGRDRRRRERVSRVLALE